MPEESRVSERRRSRRRVDHDLLMRRLERQYGLRSVMLQWFSSYLSGRTFQVVYGGSTSPTVYIPCSVPQDSVACAQSASVHPVHGGPGRPSRGTWRQFPRVCRRRAATCPLSSRRSDVRRPTTRELHCGN